MRTNSQRFKTRRQLWTFPVGRPAPVARKPGLMRWACWLAPFLCLLAEPRDFAQVAITEFMASNGKTLADSDGDSSDWIEVYNSDAVTTTADFSTPGIYTLRLTASDGALAVTDDVAINVQHLRPVRFSGFASQGIYKRGADRSD